MQQITGITSQASQQLTVSLPDGTKLIIQMQYWDQNNGWYFMNLNWNNGTWVENGRRVVSHPNMLRNYREQLPFGLACITVNNREPTNIQDFASGASGLWVLTPTDVTAVETALGVLKSA